MLFFVVVCFNGVQLQPLRGHNNSRIRPVGKREKREEKEKEQKEKEDEEEERKREREQERSFS